MNIPKTVNRLIKFMEATEKDVVDLFLTLPNAISLPYAPGQPIVFIPGTRKDRVLLVAHYDTVFDDNKKRIVKQSGTYLESDVKGLGIGADNRAGCCILWMMRKLGHSLLIVPDEEVGCLGSGLMASKYSEYLENHSYCMQFDRRGCDELVYYDTETPEFEQYMLDNFTGYASANGSFTDIVELVPAAGVCGVNVSIGFYDEHTADESLEVCAFIRTAYNTLTLLRKEQPTFPSDYTGWGNWRSAFSYDYGQDSPGFEDEDSLLFHCPYCSIMITDPTEEELYIYDKDSAQCGNCSQHVYLAECTLKESEVL